MERTHNDHADWKRVSKWLNESLDHVNVSSYDKGVDMNTHDRRFDMELGWESGCVGAADILQRHPAYRGAGAIIALGTFLELTFDGVKIFSPHGRGVTAASCVLAGDKNTHVPQ